MIKLLISHQVTPLEIVSESLIVNYIYFQRTLTHPIHAVNERIDSQKEGVNPMRKQCSPSPCLPPLPSVVTVSL